jgi:hypothetical protein
MITSSILNRELLSTQDKINILWTPTDKDFELFILSLGNTQLIDVQSLYFGVLTPHLIICNNKVEFHRQCLNLSYHLHLPVLLIDHSTKNPMFDNNKIKQLNQFPCYHHVCVNQKIKDSWELKDVQVLSYNSFNKDNQNIWKNLIYQTAKKMFLMQ